MQRRTTRLDGSTHMLKPPYTLWDSLEGVEFFSLSRGRCLALSMHKRTQYCKPCTPEGTPLHKPVTEWFWVYRERAVYRPGATVETWCEELTQQDFFLILDYVRSLQAGGPPPRGAALCRP